jgi:hypothetical protein
MASSACGAGGAAPVEKQAQQMADKRAIARRPRGLRIVRSRRHAAHMKTIAFRPNRRESEEQRRRQDSANRCNGSVFLAGQNNSVIGLVPESTKANGRPAGPGKVVSRFKPKLWKMVATTSFGAMGRSAG